MGLPKIAILICSFNESKTLAKVVRDASKFGKVLVINDGSTDNTKEMIKKFKVFKINNTVNEGYENCINKGLRFLKSKKFEYVITMDADGQHKVSDLSKIYNFIKSRKYDLVISKRSKLHKFSEKLLSFHTKKKLGFSDILSGLKGYKLSLFSKKNLELNLKNDVAGTNYLLDSIKRKKKIIEILISSHRRKFGNSKFYSKIQNNMRVFMLILKIPYLNE